MHGGMQVCMESTGSLFGTVPPGGAFFCRHPLCLSVYLPATVGRSNLAP